MPVYDFKCINETCAKEFEASFQTFSAYEAEKNSPNLRICKGCGGRVEKQISRNTSFILKGSGFHSTDYGKRGRR